MTRNKLVRLHKKGLIPRPETRHLTGARGTESLYPPGTAGRLTKVIRMRQADRRFDEVAWRLWWDGEGSADDARELLDKKAISINETITKVRRLLSDQGTLTDAGERYLEYVGTANLRAGPLGWVRRRLASQSQNSDAFEDFSLVLVRVVRGDELCDSDVERFEVGVGLDTARQFSFATGDPWAPKSSMFDALLWMTRMLVKEFSGEALSVSEGELEAARDDAKEFLGLFVNLGQTMRWIFGRVGPWILVSRTHLQVDAVHSEKSGDGVAAVPPAAFRTTVSPRHGRTAPAR
jgi:hypothetical protein